MLKANITSPGRPFLVKIILFCDTKILNFLSTFKSLFLPIKWIFIKNEQVEHEPRGVSGQENKLSKEEVNIVMNSLGICSRSQGDDIYYEIGEKDISELFEEEEPSLGELKEAFGIFDENKDGFIDASELGRVLCSLGLVVKETWESRTSDEGLRMMIKAVDENEDGVIDFHEFLRFMEQSCFV